jgi:hypothetical protein
MLGSPPHGLACCGLALDSQTGPNEPVHSERKSCRSIALRNEIPGEPVTNDVSETVLSDSPDYDTSE